MELTVDIRKTPGFLWKKLVERSDVTMLRGSYRDHPYAVDGKHVLQGGPTLRKATGENVLSTQQGYLAQHA